MFHFLLRIRIRNPTQFLFIKQGGSNPTTTTPTHLKFIHNKSISKTPQENLQEPNPSLTLSYLTNSCGLSPQSALSAAKHLTIKSTDNPDSVLGFFKSHGFADAQIAKLVAKCPKLLQSRLENTIKPKIEHFQSAGYSGADLASLVSSVPHVLTASLGNRIKPNLELLASIIGSTHDVASAVRQTSRLLQCNLETNLLPNVQTLESCGVPRTSIAKLAARHPRAIMVPGDQFKVTVGLIREMGFNPLSTMFIHGVAAVSRLNASTWNEKVAVYRSVGWSRREVISAFVKQPNCMVLSERKIRKAMDYYVKKTQWGPSFVSAHPVLMCLSLEKRVMPRCSVMRVLESKRLETRTSSAHFLMIGEKDFLSKYVIKYKNQAPEVLEAYKVNLEFIEPEQESTCARG